MSQTIGQEYSADSASRCLHLKNGKMINILPRLLALKLWWLTHQGMERSFHHFILIAKSHRKLIISSFYKNQVKWTKKGITSILIILPRHLVVSCQISKNPKLHSSYLTWRRYLFSKMVTRHRPEVLHAPQIKKCWPVPWKVKCALQ